MKKSSLTPTHLSLNCLFIKRILYNVPKNHDNDEFYLVTNGSFISLSFSFRSSLIHVRHENGVTEFWTVTKLHVLHRTCKGEEVRNVDNVIFSLLNTSILTTYDEKCEYKDLFWRVDLSEVTSKFKT